MNIMAKAKPSFVHEHWFKQALLGGGISLLGIWSFGIFGEPVKLWVYSTLADSFARLDIVVFGFSVISDLIFAFVIKK